MKTLVALLAFALNPQQTAVHADAYVRWRENHCEGYAPGDCSVREPGTAQVVVDFHSGRVVRLLVRCKTKGCVAGAAEVADWVERARVR